ARTLSLPEANRTPAASAGYTAVSGIFLSPVPRRPCAAHRKERPPRPSGQSARRAPPPEAIHPEAPPHLRCPRFQSRRRSRDRRSFRSAPHASPAAQALLTRRRSARCLPEAARRILTQFHVFRPYIGQRPPR